MKKTVTAVLQTSLRKNVASLKHEDPQVRKAASLKHEDPQVRKAASLQHEDHKSDVSCLMRDEEIDPELMFLLCSLSISQISSALQAGQASC